MKILEQFKNSLPPNMDESLKILITGLAELLMIKAFNAGSEYDTSNGCFDIDWTYKSFADYKERN